MPRTGIEHRRTDPACAKHRPPSGPLSRWWFDRNRGVLCRRCAFERAIASWLDA